jgi:hypothetical protein
LEDEDDKYENVLLDKKDNKNNKKTKYVVIGKKEDL